MKIIWTDDLSVGVDAIDEQHKHFISLINKLYDAVDKETTHESIKGLLSELEEYAKYHFETEEKYFKEFNYSGAEEHIREHRNLTKRLDHLIADEEKGKKTVVIETIYFLEDWLKNHLAKQDKKYVDCFKDHGLV
jgi:hemerythrin-like metal-binding protein